jgi:hypothetical protein
MKEICIVITESLRGLPDPPISQNRDVPEISELIKSYSRIRDKVVSNSLQKDLMEHIWQLYGNGAGPFVNRQGFCWYMETQILENYFCWF